MLIAPQSAGGAVGGSDWPAAQRGPASVNRRAATRVTVRMSPLAFRSTSSFGFRGRLPRRDRRSRVRLERGLCLLRELLLHEVIGAIDERLELPIVQGVPPFERDPLRSGHVRRRNNRLSLAQLRE